MTARMGEAFDANRAVADIDLALITDLPESGPTTHAGEPVTGEWTHSMGDGFRLFPLWEGDCLVGMYGPEWTAAEEKAQEHFASLTAVLDSRWGPHRKVTMGPALWNPPTTEPFRTLVGKDCLGDLNVWGPVSSPHRWVAISLNQSDGDAPMILVAVVAARPITTVA